MAEVPFEVFLYDATLYAQNAAKKSISSSAGLHFGLIPWPYVVEMTRNPQIMIPFIITNVLVPHLRPKVGCVA